MTFREKILMRKRLTNRHVKNTLLSGLFNLLKGETSYLSQCDLNVRINFFRDFSALLNNIIYEKELSF